MASDLKTRVLLLVEDNPADAELVMDMLQSDLGNYNVFHVSRLSEAKEMLETRQVDVVLLDLRLPDASGVDSVRSILTVAQEMPVVVLTGLEDEQLALRCIDAGAQDYLNKDELKPKLLRRTIGYAITRLREAQVRELQTTLSNYRALSSEGRRTSVTAALSGVGPIQDRQRDAYDALLSDYQDLFDAYIEQLGYKREKPTQLMAHLATRVGDLGGGPRDLLDIHVAALETAIQGMTVERTRYFVVEGRLLALEMMGLLVDYYRVGQRRLTPGGTQ
jgi:CheY-like chemotaxis protein